MTRLIAAAAASLLSLLALAAGCSSPDSAVAGEGAALDLGLDAGTAIKVAATSASLKRDFDVSIAGTGDTLLQKISLVHGAGSVTFAGAEAPALATYEQDATGLGLDGTQLYQILAVQKTRLITLWAYCSNQQLSSLYYETSDGHVTPATLDVTGTCTDSGATVTEKVALPALALPFPAAVEGYSMTGADVSFPGGRPGDVHILDRDWNLYPFNVVDCTSCATPGWYELHSLLWNAAAKQTCFGIFYLMQGVPDSVEMDYPVCLGGGVLTANGSSEDLPATWTSPAGVADAGAPGRHRFAPRSRTR